MAAWRLPMIAWYSGESYQRAEVVLALELEDDGAGRPADSPSMSLHSTSRGEDLEPHEPSVAPADWTYSSSSGLIVDRRVGDEVDGDGGVCSHRPGAPSPPSGSLVRDALLEVHRVGDRADERRGLPERPIGASRVEVDPRVVEVGRFEHRVVDHRVHDLGDDEHDGGPLAAERHGLVDDALEVGQRLGDGRRRHPLRGVTRVKPCISASSMPGGYSLAMHSMWSANNSVHTLMTKSPDAEVVVGVLGPPVRGAQPERHADEQRLAGDRQVVAERREVADAVGVAVETIAIGRGTTSCDSSPWFVPGSCAAKS